MTWKGRREQYACGALARGYLWHNYLDQGSGPVDRKAGSVLRYPLFQRL